MYFLMQRKITINPLVRNGFGEWHNALFQSGYSSYTKNIRIKSFPF